MSARIEAIRQRRVEREMLYASTTVRRLIAEAVARGREAFPNLSPVIAWLENGCDPKEAAKELRIYMTAIRARGGE